MPRVIGLGHIGIHARDLERMVALYRDLLGMQVTRQNWRAGVVSLSADPASVDHKIALMRRRTARDETKLIQPISMRVPSLDDLRAFRRRLVAEGYRIGLLIGLAFALDACAAGSRPADTTPSPAGAYVTYATGEYELRGRLCKPEGPGPFAAVVYSHGGSVVHTRNGVQSVIAGAPDQTCVALAKAGFVGFSPIRRPTKPFVGHPADVATAIDYVAALPYVDGTRLGLVGFSSGATVTYVLAAARGRPLKTVVIMGTAGAERAMNVDPAGVTAPVLVLVAENDTGSPTTFGNNTVAASDDLVATLKRAGRDVTYKVYPPYGRDGHRMFFEIGAYWTDVAAFLKRHLEG